MRDLRTTVMAAALGAAVASATPSVWAQTAAKTDDPAIAAIRADLEKVKAELENVRGELRLMRELLIQRLAQPQPAPSPAAPARVSTKVSVGDNPTLGRKDAPVTIVEFSDYQCPFCRQFVQNTLPALKKEYVEAGKVRYVFRDFPLDQIHPQARKASEAARCAGDQGKYWEMHDTLFQNQQALQPDQLKTHASGLGLDEKAFAACLDAGKYQASVKQNYDEGVSAGVRGTPSFVIGKTRSDGTVEGFVISGARPANDFRQEIERVLAEK
jgi:protein-disulfide isomerase